MGTPFIKRIPSPLCCQNDHIKNKITLKGPREVQEILCVGRKLNEKEHLPLSEDLQVRFPPSQPFLEKVFVSIYEMYITRLLSGSTQQIYHLFFLPPNDEIVQQ